MRRAAAVSVVVALVAAAAATFVLTRPEAAEPPEEPARPAPDDPTPSPAPLDPAKLREARWLAVASGETPEFNQVSIEQDLALAREVLGEGGVTLFAAGPDHPTVQELAAAQEHDRVLDALADLFAPRGGRDATYRAPGIEVDGPATATTVSDALKVATDRSGPPLLLYLAGHGLQGDAARHNSIGFWARSSLTVVDFAEQLHRSKRPIHVVATTCFSGGLAELVFEDADDRKGPARKVTCGLFAAPWDLEASGCDPNPDRAAQEGYAIHFLHALRGEDRDGESLPSAEIDFDGDGEISLLEAHTRVRIASAGPDVPTTTTERWLEHVIPEVPVGEVETEIDLPEEDAVIAALSARLGAIDAVKALDELEDEIEKTQRRQARAQEAEERAFRRASAELLARWPTLDDPWHPDFNETLSENHTAIGALLETSPSYAAYQDAKKEVDALSNAVADLRVQAAPIERLVRAQEFRSRAAALRTSGGSPLKRYEELLRCERFVAPQFFRGSKSRAAPH